MAVIFKFSVYCSHMSHNIKTSLWTLAAALIMTSAASAATPPALEIIAADLGAAGVPDVVEVPPAGDRFNLPVRYFRSSEKLSAADTKLDCKDCGDLISVYVAQVSAVPGWHYEKSRQFMKIGGRLQLRVYIPAKKRIVTVTAVNEASLRKISKYLVEKFSK